MSTHTCTRAIMLKIEKLYKPMTDKLSSPISFKESYKKMLPKQIVNLANKIKNKSIKISRKIKILKTTKNKLTELTVKLKKETSVEKTHRLELLNSIKNIDNQIVECTSLWDKYRQSLRRCVLKKDPRNFLRWDPVVETMSAGARRPEFDYLINNDWNKWSSAIKETWIGNPPKYKYYENSSGNFINTAYNLSRLIDHHKLDLKQVGKIIEFGGGYGCMAKLVNNLGFMGKYVIFDIPEFLALQKYYLNSNNTDGNIHFINQAEKLDDSNPDIFIATWSLSESPIELRDEFLKKIGKPKYVLIAYQANFETIDNVKYFQEYIKNNQDYNWVNYEISFLHQNYYLIGNREPHLNK